MVSKINPRLLSWELVPFDFYPLPSHLQLMADDCVVTQDLFRKYYSGRIGDLLDRLSKQDVRCPDKCLMVTSLKDFPLSDILGAMKILVYLVGLTTPALSSNFPPLRGDDGNV